MKWTSELPQKDGWYFVRTVLKDTGEPSRDISVEHINARRLAEQEKRREQALISGRLIALRREEWAGPIPEPEERA